MTVVHELAKEAILEALLDQALPSRLRAEIQRTLELQVSRKSQVLLAVANLQNSELPIGDRLAAARILVDYVTGEAPGTVQQETR